MDGCVRLVSYPNVIICHGNLWTREQFDGLAAKCLGDDEVRARLNIAGMSDQDARDAFNRQFLTEIYPAGVA